MVSFFCNHDPDCEQVFFIQIPYIQIFSFAFFFNTVHCVSIFFRSSSDFSSSSFFFPEAYLIKALLSPLRSVGVWCTWAFQVSKDV